MKKFLLSLLAALLAITAQVEATGIQNVIVNTKTAGTLSSTVALLAETYNFQTSEITNLTVNGPINGTDARFINSLGGTLAGLDLSNANIVRGGTYYSSFTAKNDSIGDYMFKDMTALDSVKLPTAVKYIGVYAFNNSKIKEVTIPDNVESMAYCFCYCANLTDVTIGKGGCYFDQAFMGSDAIKNITFLATPPYIYLGEYSLPYSATLTVPKGMKELYASANIWGEFSNIVESPNEAGESIAVTLSSAGTLASKLNGKTLEDIASLSISGDINSDDVATIREMKYLCSLDLSKANIVEGGSPWEVALHYEDYVIEGNYIVDIVKWDEIKSCTTTKNTISCRMLYEMNAIAELKLPTNITSIDDGALCGCYRLASIDIPEGVTDVKEQAFNGCYMLKKAKLPSTVTKIDSMAFIRNASLESINLPDGLASIGDYAFSHTGCLKSVEFPKTLETIGEYAFMYSALESVSIPASVTKIGNGVFAWCTELASADIKSNNAKIGKYAFRGCTSLSAINLGSADESSQSKYATRVSGQTMSLGDNTFTSCPITQISACPSTPPTCGTDVFDADVLDSAKLYVTADAKSAYETADTWKEFFEAGNVFEMTTGIQFTDYANSESVTSVYNINGYRTDKLQKGINVIRYSDGRTRKVIVK